MKICHVVVALNGQIAFRGYALPGQQIAENLHLGHVILVDGELTISNAAAVPGLSSYLPQNIEPKHTMGFYGISPQ